MSGITSALNIAKNALLAFQTAVHVTSHNVSNVDTEGYSRQKIVTTPYPPSPSPVGPIGSGVKIDQIKRYFDVFLEANLNLKRTDLGFFTAEETGMRLVESIFNETGELGLSQLLNDFFSAWQTLSNRPEGLPERRLVVEKGKLLAENISEKFRTLKELEDNVGQKLKSIVEQINRLAKEIAEINLQITAAETGGHQANDLRDQRDRLIAELSKLAPIRYFENKDGAYNVILGRGFNLVDVDRSWELDLSGTEVYWVGHRGERARLTSQEISGGEFGGWLRILEQISDEWNHEYVSSTRAIIKEDGSPLFEDTTFRELGLSVGDTFEFSGTDHFGNAVSGSFRIESIEDLDKTVRDLLDEIEKAYGFTVTAYLKDGRIFIKDAYRGSGELEFAFTRSPLDFGRFDEPGLNYRVKELNLTGKLSAFAEELIRAINRIHSEGVGLKFFTGELEGTYQTADYIKTLPFFLDLNRNGSLFIWIKDPSGNLTPVRVDFELPSDALLTDVADQINAAILAQGFDPNQTVRATVRNGRLVFQAQEGWAFAFSNDTSGILASTGINVFFTGIDAASIEVNELLSVHPEYVAAARLDREAWRSEIPVTGLYRSRKAIVNPDSLIFSEPDHTLYVKFFDAQGKLVEELGVDVASGDSLADILDKLDALEGLRAYIDVEGRLVLGLDPNSSKSYAYFELGVEDPNTTGSFLAYLRDEGVWVPQYIHTGDPVNDSQIFSGLEPLVKPTQYVGNIGSLDPASLSFSGTLTIRYFNSQGEEVGSETFSGATNLQDLITAIDGSTNLKAYIDHGQVVMALDKGGAPPEIAYFVIESDDTARSWGKIKLDAGTPYELTFTMGTLENWVYDETGKPIDTDTANKVVDPFRVTLTTDQGLIQIVNKYNATENARWGLSAEIDANGRLLVKTTGLYDTRSFVVTDAFRREAFSGTVYANRFDSDTNTWYFLTDEAVSTGDSFSPQDIVINYQDADNNIVHTETLSFGASFTLNDFISQLRSLDSDGDGQADFEVKEDDSGRLVIRVKDSDRNNDGRPDWVRFRLESSLGTTEEGNLATYLARRVFGRTQALADTLQGFDIKSGDNRNALRISDLSDSKREALGEASLYDYYTAVVGEIGVAGKRVSEAKTFMEDLIKQLQLMRDSISAVSLDEEMANLMKYQQAFAAAAKLLTTTDEMLMTLIESKR
ncbi:flagellar hook-associated protein FlgK [Thermosulfurimonas dismutans]|uniref:Flagellar hook-associated protein 1 n=1 Tax=Thermosulfurimonas dismutans TaxID=999894 RepID=A0A179D4S9_9BACT|nr:flagellar hook-associated protein FlgK [Thermosulfurimonas dismutans]OAQ20472.1 Flagellar hook-associated protein FlgK [Thermosulfurimonas dismutans]